MQGLLSKDKDPLPLTALFRQYALSKNKLVTLEFGDLLFETDIVGLRIDEYGRLGRTMMRMQYRNKNLYVVNIQNGFERIAGMWLETTFLALAKLLVSYPI